jgi:peptidoglycan-N-acetylglucosamine deacetylase
MGGTGLYAKKKWRVLAWLTWERLFHRWFSVIPIDANNPYMYYRICKYRGKPIALTGDEAIVSGDRMVELHFNNEALLNLLASSRSFVHLAAQLIHHTKHLLPIILEKIEVDPHFHDVKGVFGITMIHQGSQRLGFLVQDIPRGFFSLLTRMYLSVLLSVIHPEGSKRLNTKRVAFVPKLLIMSTKELRSKYGHQRNQFLSM